MLPSVKRIVEFDHAAVGLRGHLEPSRDLELEGLMRPFPVVAVEESIEAGLLVQKARRTRPGCLRSSTSGEFVVLAVLLGAQGPDSVEANAETKPPRLTGAIRTAHLGLAKSTPLSVWTANAVCYRSTSRSIPSPERRPSWHAP